MSSTFHGRCHIHDGNGTGWYGDVAAELTGNKLQVTIEQYAPVGDWRVWDEIILGFIDGGVFVGKPMNMWASLTSQQCGIDIIFEEQFTEVLKI